MNGQVHRYTETSGNWTRTRLDTLGGVNDLPISGPITDIAVDPADATGNSIYITFGGFNDWRHVWHFDGNQWQHRSGPSDGHINSVLDVQHNAVIVDPQNPNHVYVGADIGIWRSVDGGLNWQPFSEGLPDASVMDLKLHNNRRLLRASTHGRGVYERTLGSEPKLGIELYVRDTQLDQGRFTTINGLNDPTDITKTVWHYHSVDIKLDTPDYYGNYQFPLTGTINFLQFTDTLTDDYQNVATHATATITTRVYVQVHNRGVIPADNVRVMLLLTPAAGGLPALPPGYQVNVQNGTPIETPDWTTVGIATLNDIRVGVPKIASLNLTSDKLPPPANLAGNQHHCVVALLHHDDDKYTSTITNTDQNTLQNRKAAHKNLHVVQFYGTVPTQPPVAVAVRINNAELVKKEYVISLRLDDYPDKVRVFIPPIRLTDEFKELIDGLYIDDDFDDFKKWSESHIEMLKMQDPKHQYHEEWVNQRVKDIQKVLDNPLMLNVENRKNASINGLIMDPSSYHTFFLMIDRPKDAKTGEYYNFNIQQWDSKRESLIGGMSTRIELVPKPESDEKYKLELRYHNLIFGYKLMRAKLTDESGAQITPSDGAKVVLTIQSGGDSTRSNMGYLSWLLSSFYSITMKKIDSASAVAFRDNVKVAETTL
jgi:hypothetical protein